MCLITVDNHHSPEDTVSVCVFEQDGKTLCVCCTMLVVWYVCMRKKPEKQICVACVYLFVVCSFFVSTFLWFLYFPLMLTNPYRCVWRVSVCWFLSLSFSLFKPLIKNIECHTGSSWDCIVNCVLRGNVFPHGRLFFDFMSYESPHRKEVVTFTKETGILIASETKSQFELTLNYIRNLKNRI